ncbi:hypothetical protein C8R43DRAFT_940767 [Mycena crocata]|nr:hypothetical protein C8R43DRAFT_940767 [Mycena crocata]
MSDDSFAPESNDIIIPSFSQRDDTTPAENEIHCLGIEWDAQQERCRSRYHVQADSEPDSQSQSPPRPSALAATKTITELYEPNEALDSQANSQEWLQAQLEKQDSECKIEAGQGELVADNSADSHLDFELLRLQYNDMEADQDKFQAECKHLQAKLRETEVSLRFFQRETGRWRWAAASMHTKIQGFLRELGAAAMVLRFPDGPPANPKISTFL